MPTAAQLPAGLPLLEREAEVETIQALVELARAGDGRLLAIEGRAGIGKSRLVAEARRLGDEAGLEVLAARAGELEQDFAFGVVRQLFEPLLGAATAEERADITSGAAALALPLFEEPELAASREGAGDSSFAMLHGLYWLAGNLALRRPALLAVDDLHWADAPSLRWIAYLARRLEGLPLLVALASRPPEQSRHSALLTEVLSDPAAVVLRPGPLTAQAIAALANEAFGSEASPEFVSAAQTATGGNPLFLRALLDTLLRERLEPSAENAGRVLEAGPEAVSRSVSLRLARLPPEATALIRAAAALGDGMALHLAAKMAELDVATAGRAATMLVRFDLLRREDPVEFAHPVVRTVVYQEMEVDERVRVNRRAAELLLEAGAPPEQAAAHLVLTLPAADPFVTATLRLAAERSLAEGAPQAAIAYLGRALEEPPRQEERGELLRALGTAELQAGAVGAVEHLEAAFTSIEDPVGRAETALRLALALVFVNRWSDAIQALRQGIDGLGDHRPELAELLEAVLVTFAVHQPELNRVALERIGQVREDALHPGLGAAVMRAVLAFHEARLGQSRDRTVALAKRALEDASFIRSSEIVFGIQAIFALTLAGELETASGLYAEALDDARRRGDLLSIHTLLLFRGFLMAQRGELLAAEDDLRSAELDPSLQAALTLYRAGYLADILVERGEIAEAERSLKAVDLTAQVHTGHYLSYLYGRGRVRLEAGRREEAFSDFRTLGDHAESLGIRNPAIVPWRSQAALALHLLGRETEARELALEEVDLARRWGAPRTIGISLRALGLVQGGGEGQRLLRDAVEVLEGSAAKLEYARALIDLGAALRRAKRRTEAQGLVRRGLELANRSGATSLVRRAQDELAAMGMRPRKIALVGVEALTPSERRVARMAADGMSNKDIAQALFVTVKAVEVHLTSAYRKLGIAARGELGAALGERHSGHGGWVV